MDLNTKLKDLQYETQLADAKLKLKLISKELEESIKEGFHGKVFGFYISPTLGTLLTNEVLGWTTFSDGEFEESSIWIK
jgi:hypothetical protein